MQPWQYSALDHAVESSGFLQVIALADYRAQLSEYLKNRMIAIAPNLTILVGELVGARLIAHAGKGSPLRHIIFYKNACPQRLRGFDTFAACDLVDGNLVLLLADVVSLFDAQ